MTLEELVEKHSPVSIGIPTDEEWASLPPYRLPKEDDLLKITRMFNCPFPPSFVQFQTQLGSVISYPELIGWAVDDIPFGFCVESLESIVETSITCSWPVARFLSPFMQDEDGNFYCFDSRNPDKNGEFPVVFWDHDEGGILEVEHYYWSCFVEWLDHNINLLDDGDSE